MISSIFSKVSGRLYSSLYNNYLFSKHLGSKKMQNDGNWFEIKPKKMCVEWEKIKLKQLAWGRKNKLFKREWNKKSQLYSNKNNLRVFFFIKFTTDDISLPSKSERISQRKKRKRYKFWGKVGIIAFILEGFKKIRFGDILI